MQKQKIDVEKVAKLANLPVTEEEKEKYSDQLTKILGYIDELQKVDTTGIEPTYNVTGLNSVFREDIPSESLSQKAALQNAKEEKKGFFVTKGVFEEE
jgi:aspartyl-tRNA(Asn)/glutamyl-tRNA(Gln) amidotransferase subunit C